MLFPVLFKTSYAVERPSSLPVESFKWFLPICRILSLLELIPVCCNKVLLADFCVILFVKFDK